MDDLETRHRIGRARLLRRTGKTYDEIRDVVGGVRDETLAAWLRGIPRPPATYRSRGLVELRRRCRQLRAEGLTYGEIHEQTRVSMGSLSLWLRDMPVPERCEERRSRQLELIRGRGGAARRQQARDRRQRRFTAAARSIGSVSDRELFVAGLALYWAEGTKDKPWNRNGRVVLINSDPSVLAVFLAWLDLVGVPRAARSFRLSIHESADAGVHERWWSEVLDIPPTSFRRATLKRHNPTSRRHNRKETYHGCLTISVAKSRALYDSVDGWWRGVVAGSTTSTSQAVPLGPLSPGSSNGRTSVFGTENGGSTPPPGAESSPWSPLGWWDTVQMTDD